MSNRITVTLFTLLLALASPIYAQSFSDRYSEGEYSGVDIVPASVMAVVKEAKPSAIPRVAKITWETDDGIYTVIASVGSKLWRIRVSSAGRLMSVNEE